MISIGFIIFIWLNLCVRGSKSSHFISSGLPGGVCLLEDQACGMHDNVVAIINNINNLEECTHLCQDEVNCNFVTFYGQTSFPFSDTCIMFSSCDDLVDCVDCISEDSTCKEVSCTASEMLESKIDDNLVSFIPDLPEEKDCRRKCRDNSECLFFTYHDLQDSSFPGACFLLKTLKAPLKSCSHCRTGPKTCEFVCSLLHQDGRILTSLQLTEPASPVNVTAVSLGISCQLSVVAVGGGGQAGNSGGAGSGRVEWNVFDIGENVTMMRFEAVVAGGMESSTVFGAGGNVVGKAGSDSIGVTGGSGYSGGGASSYSAGVARGGSDGGNGGSLHRNSGGSGSGINVRTIPAGAFTLT